MEEIMDTAKEGNKAEIIAEAAADTTNNSHMNLPNDDTTSSNPAIADFPKLFTKKRSKYCSHCRISEEDGSGQMLRCSRCKIAHFCSPACQKVHHPAHRQLCRQYADLVSELLPLEEKLDCNSRVPAEQEPGLLTAKEISRFQSMKKQAGDIAFQVAYSTCDIPQRGAVGMEVALKHYMELLQVVPLTDDRTEELVAVLLVILDYDEHAYSFIKLYTSAPRDDVWLLESIQSTIKNHVAKQNSDWVYGNISDRNIPEQEHRSSILENLAFSVAVLLLLMKKLAKERSATSSQEKDNALIDMLDKDTRQWVEDINEHYPGFLFHLLNSIPLLHSDRYDLFHPNSPEYFWHLLQDGFFLTPGVNSILSEMVDDVED